MATAVREMLWFCCITVVNSCYARKETIQSVSYSVVFLTLQNLFHFLKQVFVVRSWNVIIVCMNNYRAL